MAKQDQQDLRDYYASKGILVPSEFKFPVCDHPIEKWCKHCDYDYETYKKIPHFRKYKEIYMWTEEEFNKERELRNKEKHGR